MEKFSDSLAITEKNNKLHPKPTTDNPTTTE
jgi:hypothetical protein